MYKYLQDRWYKQVTHWIDNEAPAGIKRYNVQNTMKYQLVPPNLRRTNAVERVIRMFKKHYIAILASVDPNFPMHLWGRLLPQACMTRNILQPCRLNPKLSTYLSLEGIHDYSAHHIAPFGIEVTVHKTANQQATWGVSGVKGWYIGPTLERYCCYK
eukprot:5882544-Ditylum_brightwellii.AAC.1